MSFLFQTFEAVAEFPQEQHANGYAYTPTKSQRFKRYQDAYEAAEAMVNLPNVERVGVFDGRRWVWLKDE